MNTKIAFTLIAVLFTISSFAQKTIRIDDDENEETQYVKTEKQEIKTLFSKEKRDGFYGSLSVGYSPIDHKDGVTTSMRGCWIMDHFFSLGVGGTAFVIGKPAIVEHLKQYVEYVGMRFFDFVEEHHAVRFASDFLGKLPALIISNISRRRSHKS